MKLLLILAALAGLTSCTFRINADGSKSGSIDGAALIQILADK
jgi:hypothetical protein